jgi:hypothetical protein
MKKTKFSLVRTIFLTLFIGTLLPSYAQCIPSLGGASGFAIYTAGGAVANTAISTINGDIGTNLGAITGFTTAVVSGSYHNGTTLTQTAAQDLSTAYSAFQNLTPTITDHNMVFGNGETISAGVYSIASAVAIAGTLTLNGQNNPNAKFIIQVGGALNSSAGATIVLTNGATPNNVYWIVLNACGLGANTTFFGTIMAGAAIAAGIDCQIQGKLLSVGGAIAINNTNLANNGGSMFYGDADYDGYGNPNISSCVYVAGYVNNDKDCNDYNASINPSATEIWGNYIDEDCDGIIFRPQEQCLPSVGMASEFTLFTGSGAITHSATVSNITGNIGTNLGTIAGFELSTVTGTFINANSTTQTAKEDLISAYTQFQNLTPTITDHAAAFGSETLTAGIYSIGGAGSLGGTLTLDGQNNPNGRFVFKFGGAFTTGAGSSIVLINGALPKNIYWIANGAAALAANVTFKGTIINNAALSVGFGCALNGKLLTTTGAITVLGSTLVNSGGVLNTFYVDNDGDGYGGSSNSVLSNSCSLAAYTLVGNDCNDANTYIHPNAIEIPNNGIDDNCNGIIDTDAIISTWSGTTNNSWNTASNWTTNKVPLPTDFIIISSGTPVLDTNFTVGSGRTLTISGSGTLTINPTSILTIAGTANFGGKAVTIKSNATGNGTIGQVIGTLSGATNVTVERYVPANRSWRALTAPLKGSNTSIFSQWQNNGAISSGVGIELWSPNGNTSPSSSNTGLAIGPNSSILQYVSGAWSGVTNTNTTNLFTTNGNNAFMVFPTGQYGCGLISSTATPIATTLKATGQLITGDVLYTNLPSTSHTLIGNPYASPLSLTSMLSDNLGFGANIWIWDANVAGGNAVGTFNLFSAVANSYTNIISNPNISATTLIQSGQAFFVLPTLNLSTFTIKEAHKGTAFSNAVLRNAAPELLRVGLYKQINTDWYGRDGAMTVITPDADANQVPNKMANGTENVAFTKNSGLFASYQHLPLIAADVLNVKVWNTTAGTNYKLKINTEQFTSNLTATLEDLFTNARTPLPLDGSAVDYPFAVTTDALSTGNRFRIVFQTSALEINNPKANGFSVFPNPVTGDSFQVNLGILATGTYSYTICNAIGQEVEKGSINNAAQDTNYEVKMNNLATGIYIMKIKGSNNSVFTAKIIKK